MKLSRRVVQPHEGMSALAAVLQRVGERFLHQPVDGELDTGRNIRDAAMHLERGGESGGSHLGDERVELQEIGLRL